MAKTLTPEELRAKSVKLRRDLLPGLMRAAEAEIARMPDDPADTNTFTSLYDYWLPINTIISQARATQRGY